MAADARVFSLTVPSDPKMLSVTRSFVEAVAQACALERRIIHAVVTATGEAVTNIIRHAHRNLPFAQLHLQIQIHSEAVVLVFRDQGEPFDVTSVPYMNPAEMRIGGRGVFLMRALMDEVSCEPCPPGQRGNTLRLMKRCADVQPMRTVG